MANRNTEQGTDHKMIMHETGHIHGDGCGHQAVQHGDHTDYIVDGKRHHPHNGHCDDHGRVETSAERKR